MDFSSPKLKNFFYFSRKLSKPETKISYISLQKVLCLFRVTADEVVK